MTAPILRTEHEEIGHQNLNEGKWWWSGERTGSADLSASGRFRRFLRAIPTNQPDSKH
ncbi:hypothetical protein Isop_1693 [Isosphaera pallida ATCC 43644]|uniref:Uncharacterized protein n=1 Tax=Isosphaera pallida (strain ATCC 43644 / DSM 9630 / IS1B) TaxID=575540 RepID=E8R0T1_ISOPI|nr:hypothetical protein Isop_1693 [Isosphaera pallida ATCC 43644]